MNNQNLIHYINGIIFGIKTSIKLFAKLKDNQKAIQLLCEAQAELLKGNFKSNTELWQYMQFKILKDFWSK